jgi:hypothetical protein
MCTILQYNTKKGGFLASVYNSELLLLGYDQKDLPQRKMLVMRHTAIVSYNCVLQSINFLQVAELYFSADIGDYIVLLNNVVPKCRINSHNLITEWSIYMPRSRVSALPWFRHIPSAHFDTSQAVCGNCVSLSQRFHSAGSGRLPTCHTRYYNWS